MISFLGRLRSRFKKRPEALAAVSIPVTALRYQIHAGRRHAEAVTVFGMDDVAIGYERRAIRDAELFKEIQKWTADVVGSRNQGSQPRPAPDGSLKRLPGDMICNIAANCKDAKIVEGADWQRIEKEIGAIKVLIDDCGQPLLWKGEITLALAAAMGLQSVRAYVIARHPAWQEFRLELRKFAEDSLDPEVCARRDFSHYGGRLYQQAYHFDTTDIPYSHGVERVRCIKEHVGLQMRTLLDIGANYGLFCREFEILGLECTAVEMKADDVAVMRKLRQYTGSTFTVEECSIFEYQAGRMIEFDVVLALFIFHHFLKTEEMYARLVTLLQRLRCRELFLGVHDPKENQMTGAFRNYTPEEFAQFVMTATGLTTSEPINCPGIGTRKLFKLS